ncbi:unnamed protein product [Peniophora sp. CBMAI 1063]|nr:unnamed protein product [Peniophora sp. CBMAI 1063]
MSGRATRSRTKASSVGGAPSVISANTEPDMQPPPAKRLKAQRAKKPAQTTRKKGRLSVLPTLPLDVLYEIFGHLGPTDLLHLARTTKSFRTVLMSRQSAFLWKEVHEAVDEIDKFPCPEEMSLLKWINLVYGGPYCDERGCSGRANKVLWGFYRRLCKSCQGKLLISGEDVWGSLGAEVMMLLDNLSDSVPRDMVTRGGRHRIMYLRSDIKALGEEVRALARDFDYPIHTTEYPAPDGTPQWQAALAALKARRKKMCDARHTHAEQCAEREEIKAVLRGDELDELKDARFLEVKQRLIAMGFDAVDAGSYVIRTHKEVRQAKPLTDRVWTRISPILRAEAERIRDERLQRERRLRQAVRFGFARRRYERITLDSIAPSTINFAPKAEVSFKLPRIATYLREDVDRLSSEEQEACAAAFTEADVLAFINDWISRRQTGLREILPEDWPRSTATHEEIGKHWPTPTVVPTIDHYSEVADLDLAVYAFKCTVPTCPHGERVFYGLDILAHDCVNYAADRHPGYYMDDYEALSQPIDFAVHALPLQEHHTAASRVVQLLELVPTKARPLDLDKADEFLTAEPRELDTTGQPFLTWRQAVVASVSWCKLDTVRVVDEREKSYIDEHHTTFRDGDSLHPVEDDHDWTCARCAHVADPAGMADSEVVRWATLHDVRAHISLVHGIANAEEGQHYFYDRYRDRMAGECGEGDAFLSLPHGVDLDTALSALDAYGGGVSPFDLLQSMWPGALGPPAFLLASMMADLLSDDSDDFMDF